MEVPDTRGRLAREHRGRVCRSLQGAQTGEFLGGCI